MKNILTQVKDRVLLLSSGSLAEDLYMQATVQVVATLNSMAGVGLAVTAGETAGVFRGSVVVNQLLQGLCFKPSVKMPL